MGIKSINDIINDSFLKRNFNDKSMNGKSRSALEVDNLADKLVRIYNAPNSRNFFLKCGWKLPPVYIWNTVEASKKRGIKSPIKYFVKSCSNEMAKLTIQKYS